MEYYRLTIKIPKQPWLWLRFRLLTIFLLMTIVAILFAWRTDHLEQVARHEAQVAAIARIKNPGPHWDTDQATGPPDTPTFGDQNTAWASKSADGQPEWLVLEYSKSIGAKAIQIHENHKPGAVSKVTHFPEEGPETTIWKGIDPTPQTAAGGISTLPVSLVEPVKRIKVYIDSHLVTGWNEIDAVGLVDADGNVAWAEKAWASSSYGRNNRLPGWEKQEFFNFER